MKTGSRRKERKAIAAALKGIYHAPNAEAAAKCLDAFEQGPLGQKHPLIAECRHRQWAVRSGMPATPWRRFVRDETAKITLRDDSAFPHGIHPHGRHFHEIREARALGHYQDTTLIDPRQSRDILCMLDNPGKWLLHCPTLAYQGRG